MILDQEYAYTVRQRQLHRTSLVGRADLVNTFLPAATRGGRTNTARRAVSHSAAVVDLAGAATRGDLADAHAMTAGLGIDDLAIRTGDRHADSREPARSVQEVVHDVHRSDCRQAWSRGYGQRDARRWVAPHATDQMWRIAIDSFTSHAFLVLDADGAITSWSVGAERLFGYPADDILGRHVACLFMPADQEIGVPAVALQRAERDGSVSSHRRFVHSDGTLRYVYTTLVCLRPDSAAGRLRGRRL